MRKACLEKIYQLAKKDERILFFGSDLAEGTLEKFKQEMPQRFFMEGVSEANIIGMISGLALNGKIPYFNTIAVFLTRRCFEQLVLDVALHNLKVRLIGSGGGLVYAPLGPTHLAIEDLAILRAIPNMTVIAPCDSEEMKRLMPQTVDYDGPIYIRLAKGNDEVVSQKNKPCQIGKAILIQEGTEVLMVTTGITLKIALEAAKVLVKKDISSEILHLHTIKPIDQTAIIRSARKVSAIITVEEHTVIGGLGSAVAEIIAEASFDKVKKFKRIGLPDVFPTDHGSQQHLLDKYAISTKRIVSDCQTLLTGR